MLPLFAWQRGRGKGAGSQASCRRYGLKRNHELLPETDRQPAPDQRPEATACSVASQGSGGQPLPAHSAANTPEHPWHLLSQNQTGDWDEDIARVLAESYIKKGKERKTNKKMGLKNFFERKLNVQNV